MSYKEEMGEGGGGGDILAAPSDESTCTRHASQDTRPHDILSRQLSPIYSVSPSVPISHIGTIRCSPMWSQLHGWAHHTGPCCCRRMAGTSGHDPPNHQTSELPSQVSHGASEDQHRAQRPGRTYPRPRGNAEDATCSRNHTSDKPHTKAPYI